MLAARQAKDQRSPGSKKSVAPGAAGAWLSVNSTTPIKSPPRNAGVVGHFLPTTLRSDGSGFLSFSLGAAFIGIPHH
jgi:hypothetical protein